MTKQQQQVLNMLLNDNGVTRLHASHMGIQNVTARIAELRRLGHKIDAISRVDLQGRPYTRWILGAYTLAATPLALIGNADARARHACN